jgi:hypothetical protein
MASKRSLGVSRTVLAKIPCRDDFSNYRDKEVAFRKGDQRILFSTSRRTVDSRPSLRARKL